MPSRGGGIQILSQTGEETVSHESEMKKMDNVVKRLDMSREERSAFHDWLHKHYYGEKDHMSFDRLLEVAKNFLEDYRS